MARGSTEVLRKWCSNAEDAQYCKPRGHSPGSGFSCGGGGRSPSKSASHEERSEKPARTSEPASSLTSPRQPSQPDGSAVNLARITPARSGQRRRSTGSASAQAAQLAAFAVRSADRRPSPLSLSGSCARCRVRWWLLPLNPSLRTRAATVSKEFVVRRSVGLNQRKRQGAQQMVCARTSTHDQEQPGCLQVCKGLLV